MILIAKYINKVMKLPMLNWNKNFVSRFNLTICLLFFSFCSFAADVQIVTDVAKGQGFFYSNEGKCFVVTPSHVIEDAKEIKALTASRKSYKAKLVKNFDIDLALLELKAEKKVCRGAEFSQPTKLSSLLKIYEEGVLKSKLADGSTLQTKVNIVGVDESEFLQVKPQKVKTILKQGYSGSILFIANQPSGILLEVDDGSGYVYRADALNKRLEKHFYPNGKPNNSQKETQTINEKIEGKLAKDQTVEYKFQGEANSAVEFEMLPTDGEVRYDFYILDSRGKKLFSDGEFFSNREYRFTFTPPKSGTYTVRLKGKRGHSSYHIKMSQWSLDADLRGEGNVIEIDDEISNRFAKDSVAEYKFQGEANSAVEFEMLPTDGEVRYDFYILDSRGKELFSDGEFFSNREYRFTFTPPKSGTYTVRLKGKRGHSSYHIILHAGE
ncbi:trypsin-like peptidase domain-containing protein [Thalassotalea marina]|uniref:GOLD domain-containing protein n=1 Tax=Thalassotalea marina TaxID=1673741 RepID=A0A919BJS6_9GAMM|nr:trypsin-like peptidase domain-containing protein [Thalassotalea marina]GHF94874.1 hypothetical protein GCM10017161_23970 [Thalassotalea marina]